MFEHEPWKIVVGDSGIDTRRNLVRLLGLETTQDEMLVVEECDDGQKTYDAIKGQGAHLAIIDSGINVLDPQTIARMVAPDCQVIVLNHDRSISYVMACMHAGIRDVIEKPVDAGELAQSIRRVMADAPQRLKGADGIGGRHKPAKTFLFLSTKGGVGKTTLVTALGVTLARTGRKTLVIDTAIGSGGVANLLNNSSRGRTLVDLFEEPVPWTRDTVYKYIIRHEESGLYYLTAHTDPIWSDQYPVIDPYKQLLELVRADGFEYILVDTVSRLNLVNGDLMSLADLVVTVCTQGMMSINNLTELHTACIRSQELLGFELPRELFKVVVNEVQDGMNTRFSDSLRPTNLAVSLEAKLRTEIIGMIPYDLEVRRTAEANGKPLSLTSPGSEWSISVLKLAQALTKEQLLPPPETREGIFERFMSLFGEKKSTMPGVKRP